MKKINFKKSPGVYYLSFENIAWMERSLDILTESSYKKILGNICFLTSGYFTEKSRWVPPNRSDYVRQTDNSPPSDILQKETAVNFLNGKEFKKILPD